MRLVVLAIFKRIVIEFGLPFTIGLGWTFWELRTAGTPSEYVKNFGVAFFMASWVYGQLLRIIYQQTQRERIEGLGEKLGSVSSTLEGIRVALGNALVTATSDARDEIRVALSLACSAEEELRKVGDAVQRAPDDLMDRFLEKLAREQKPRTGMNEIRKTTT